MSFLILMAALLCPQESDIDRLLKDLGSESIDSREAATRALIQLGEKAEAAVRRQSTSADPEVRSRCAEILKKIDFGKKLATVLPPPKPWSLASKGKPVKALLKELAAAAAMPVDPDGVPDIVMDRDLSQLPLLQVIDELCKRADVEPYMGAMEAWDRLTGRSLDFAPKLRFSPKFRDAPRAYRGHYRVSVESIELCKKIDFKGPMKAGDYELWLQVAWPLFLRPEGEFSLQVTSAIDSKGVERYEYEVDDPEEPVSVGLNADMLVFGNGEQFSFSLDKGPIESLSSLKGIVVLRYPVQRNVLRIEDPKNKVGDSWETGRLKVTLKKYIEEKGEAKFEVDVSGPTIGTVDLDHLRILTQDGSFLDSTESVMSGPVRGSDLKSYRKAFQLAGAKVKALEFVSDTIWHKDRFDFELKDIPFPK